MKYVWPFSGNRTLTGQLMSNQVLSSRNQPTESGGLQIFELPVFGYEANGLQRKPIIFILQKGEYQNGCFKKTKHAKFFTHTCAYQGVRNVHFLDKFGVLWRQNKLKLQKGFSNIKDKTKWKHVITQKPNTCSKYEIQTFQMNSCGCFYRRLWTHSVQY